MTEKPAQTARNPKSWSKRLGLAAAAWIIACLLFGMLSRRAVRACQEVSNQCADAGFVWQALASLSMLFGLLCVCAAVIIGVWGVLKRFGRVAQWAFVAGLVVFLATAVQSFITLGLRAKNGEAMANVQKLRKAQAYYHAKHGVYRAAKRAPQPDASGQLIWPKELARDSGWSALGWHLVGVRSWCQYEVELEGDDFIARALCDVDHDGEFGVFEGRKDQTPRRMTPHY